MQQKYQHHESLVLKIARFINVISLGLFFSHVVAEANQSKKTDESVNSFAERFTSIDRNNDQVWADIITTTSDTSQIL